MKRLSCVLVATERSAQDPRVKLITAPSAIETRRQLGRTRFSFDKSGPTMAMGHGINDDLDTTAGRHGRLGHVLRPSCSGVVNRRGVWEADASVLEDLNPHVRTSQAGVMQGGVDPIPTSIHSQEGVGGRTR